MKFIEEITGKQISINVHPFYTEKMLISYISRKLYSKPYFISLKGKKLHELKDTNNILNIGNLIDNIDYDNFKTIKRYVDEGYYNSEIIYTIVKEKINGMEDMQKISMLALIESELGIIISTYSYSIESLEYNNSIVENIINFDEVIKEEDIEHTEPTILSSSYEYKVPTKKTLTYIFDMINVSIDMPLLYLNGYYKIYKNSDSLIYKYSKKDVIHTYMYENDLVVPISMKLVEYELHIIFEATSEENKNIILELIDSNIDIEEISSGIVEGISECENTIKDRSFDMYYKVDVSKELFLEMLMNDELVGDHINVSEDIKTKTSNLFYKAEKGLTQGNEKIVFASVKSYITENYHIRFVPKRVDAKIFSETGGIFKINDLVFYIKIEKYNSNNLYKVTQFINNLLKYYKSEEEIYINEYNELLSNNGKNYTPYYPKKIIEKKKDYLGVMAELGIKNASTGCQPRTKHPSIVSPEELNKLIAETNNTEEELINSSKIMKLSSENNDYYLKCNQQETPYIGYVAKKNIPCCFKTPKKSVKYKKPDNYKLTTDKLLGFNKKGEIVPKIFKKLIYIYSKGTINNFHALGCSKENDRNSSFLNCMYKISVIRNLRQFNISRKSLKSTYKKNIEIVKQEMLNYTRGEILDILKDSNIYLDPKLFLRLMEHHFKINIILISDTFNDGDIVNPMHTYNYLKYKNNYPYCVVWEHIKEPEKSCELIGIDDTYVFDQNTPIYNILHNINKIHKNFVEIPFQYSEIDVESQEIDEYGKCRKLNIGVGDKIYSIFTPPLPPLPVKIDTATYGIPESEVDSFIKTTKSILITNKSDRLVISNNTIQMYILKQSPPKSILSKYTTNKKIATHLVEYFCWFYSTYIHNTGNTDIPTFIDKKINLDLSHTYTIQNNDFTNSTIIKDDKMIINSESLLRKLVYVLKLRLEREYNFIIDYYKYENSDRLFLDIQDFNKDDNEIILYGEHSVKNWISDSQKFFIKDYISTKDTHTQYIKNRHMDNKKFIMVYTKTLRESLRKSLSLYLQGPISTPLKYTIYTYISKNNIEKNIINPQGNDYNINIVKYTITDKQDNKVNIFNTLIEF